MNIRYFALVACAALSNQAVALNAAETNDPSTIKLYISGSENLNPAIEDLLMQNCRGVGQTTNGTLTKYTGNYGRVYSCVTSDFSNDFGSGFTSRRIAIILGYLGSVDGVFPLHSGTASAPTTTARFPDVRSCVDSDLTCDGVDYVLPDAGISDLEPTAYNGYPDPINLYPGPKTVSNSGFRSVVSVAEQVFALIVNENLYNDLAADQGTTTPSISRAAFASIFAAGYDSATLGWSPLGKNLPKKTSQVNVCSRSRGSGARPAEVFFLSPPGNSFPIQPASASAGDGIDGGTTAGQFRLTQETSLNHVVSCVRAANATGGYSIGIVGGNFNPTGTQTHFVSIDNVAPTRAAAREGTYQWVYESFFNVSKKAASTSTNLFVNAFGSALKKPRNLSYDFFLLMATPSNCSGVTASDWVSLQEVLACSRVSRNRDSRRPLTFAK